MPRVLRSATRKAAITTPDTAPSWNPDGLVPPSIDATRFNETIQLIHPKRGPLPGLTPEETRLLRRKQERLRLPSTSNALTNDASSYGHHIINALHATFIFAQAEAGTAVCISSDGWVLTCAHCFGEDEQEWQANRQKWVLDYTGLAVQIECRAWDLRRDLALARVLRVEVEVGVETVPEFASIPIPSVSATIPAIDQTPIVCIGQPGADDLESLRPRLTGYDLLQISEGQLNGLIPGADPQDNAEIGTLKHDAWTYWGHSGAPLVCARTGALLGLHSSWDDATAMRHGVPLVAIQQFLDIHLPASSPERTISGKSPDSGSI
ncbi:trypsin-like cysteine/serine peptidase domain-containing protein [Aspergillus multicolor]|uniref:S1 family peptidase n=1 Tax=Aspergillus multicolor TaxID=41759 RepID=UPI003CCDA1F7